MLRDGVLAALLAAAGSGCGLTANTISGRWTGCAAGDDIYVNVPSLDGPIEADHVACERGGFAIDVDREDFRLDLDRSGSDGHYIETVGFDLTGVNGDRDLGLIQF